MLPTRWFYIATFSASLAGGCPHKGSIMRSFDVFFVVRLHELLNKKFGCRWFVTLTRNVIIMLSIQNRIGEWKTADLREYVELHCQPKNRISLSILLFWISNDCKSTLSYWLKRVSSIITGLMRLTKKSLAYERRRYICKLFSHWLRPCSVCIV